MAKRNEQSDQRIEQHNLDTGGSDSGNGVGDGADGRGIAASAIDASAAEPGIAPKRKYTKRGNGGSAGTDAAGSETGRSRAQKTPLDLSGIESALTGIHAGIAAFTHQPHWAIDAAESKMLATGVANVARHYPQFAASQKIVDWAMLFQALAAVYGTRAYLTIQERNVKAKAAKPQSAQVLQFSEQGFMGT